MCASSTPALRCAALSVALISGLLTASPSKADINDSDFQIYGSYASYIGRTMHISNGELHYSDSRIVSNQTHYRIRDFSLDSLTETNVTNYRDPVGHIYDDDAYCINNTCYGLNGTTPSYKGLYLPYGYLAQWGGTYFLPEYSSPKAVNADYFAVQGNGTLQDATGSIPKQKRLGVFDYVDNSHHMFFDFFGTAYNPDLVAAMYENYILIGAARPTIDHDTGNVNVGAAYLFDLSTGDLLHTFHNEIIHDESSSSYNRTGFGYSVAMNDGLIMIGSYRDEAAYLYSLNDYSLIHTFTEQDGFSGSYFGEAVALGDGVAAISAPRSTKGALGGGAVYLYDVSNLVANDDGSSIPVPGALGMALIGLAGMVALKRKSA